MSQKDTSIAQKPYTQPVYASDLTWHKQGNQTERLSYKPKAIQGVSEFMAKLSEREKDESTSHY